MALGMYCFASASASSAVPATSDWKPSSRDRSCRMRGEGFVVLDHQQDALGVGQRVAIVLDRARRLRDRRATGPRGERGARRGARAGSSRGATFAGLVDGREERR